MSKPRELTAKEKVKANMAKNCLIVTLMSLELGYGSILERYKQESQSIAERYQHGCSESLPFLNSILLTDEELSTRRIEHLKIESQSQAAIAAMPPPTRLSSSKLGHAINSVGIKATKDTSLKMYHVMSVKQTLREDLAEHAYQFSCRAADWSRSNFSSVPMRFGPLELHVVIESFKRLGVCEEVPREKATSTPLPARLILVTKPNVHGGPARKKARIVICGNFQEVHPEEFTASETPSYPSLRMALSVASHMGWPIECWDASTAFLYARLFGDRDTDLGGNEIFMKPPKILVETEVVDDGVVWKIKKALYGLCTSPIAWETERDTTLKSLAWCHDETEHRLLPCPGSPCLWTVIPLHPGEDPSVKTSREELTRGVVITYVDDLLLTGWHHHIYSITKALLAKSVMKKSGSLPEGKPDAKGSSDGIDFLGARITRDEDGTVWRDQSKYILHCVRENEFIDKEGQVVLKWATAPPAVDEKLG